LRTLLENVKIEEITIDFDLYTSDSSFLWSRQRFCY
jgi:hypothetical protein